jgi:PAS domain S-box-containing protein
MIPQPGGGDSTPDARSAEMYRRLVQSVTDYAIYAIDPAGHVINWNPGAERIKGYTPEEIVGQSFTLFYTPEDLAAGRPQRLMDTAIMEGHVEDEGWRVRKDGSRFWASVALAPIRDAAGGLLGFTKVTRDLTERRAAEEAIRQSEEQFRLLVQSVKDYAILMLDPDGRIVSWNEGAERIKGYTAEEIRGRSFTVFYTEEARAAAFPEYELEQAALNGRFEDEGWRVRKDGTTFWANVVITALRGASGRLLGFAKVTRDLTERRKAEEARVRLAAEEAAHAEAARRSEELERLNEELQNQSAALEEQANEMEEQASEMQSLMVQLEEAIRARDEVTSIVSHDLRNPVNTITMAAALLTDFDLGEEKRHSQATVIRRCATQMTRLLDDLLEMSKAEGGRLAIETRPDDLAAIAREAFETFSLRASDLGLDLRFNVPDDLPRVLVDRDRIMQVLSNLLGNAVKFTPRGGQVSLSAESAGSDVAVHVRDTGIGIAKADIPHVFDRFWQAKRAERASAGLGLAIAKSIIESHGGRIRVDSSEGRGTDFCFTVPAAARADDVRS